jgi:hypothetical protein
MPNLLQLALKLENLVNKSTQRANEIAKATAEATLIELAYNTPVDTSQAISNWQVGINDAPTRDIAPHFRGVRGSTYSQSAAETIFVGKSKIEAKKPGETIYISNLLEYINILNAGSSLQAPAGFIEAAIYKGELTGQQFAKKYDRKI